MNTEESNLTSIGELVRKAEDEYVNGTVQNSKYVSHSMDETINTIYAYLNSKHISGEYDSQGREKPFPNVVVAAANIWMRATDIDRRNIKFRATKMKDWIDTFLASVLLQAWMKKARFGTFLNKWGRILSRYGSAVVKVVENSSGLSIEAKAWSVMIVDAVDFASNPKIEILWLTEAQLYKRVETHGYDLEAVKGLCNALRVRETQSRQRKDNKTGYIKLYEVHGMLSETLVTGNYKDQYRYVQQMHILSYVETKKGRKSEFQDFSMYKGREKFDPYYLTHLIEEDDRTLSIGCVENLFQAQWMENHSAKNVKDRLDYAAKLLLQTSDTAFVGVNSLMDLDNGSILVHKPNQGLTRIDNTADNINAEQAFVNQWKSLKNELVGISEAMLGGMPKSGTAWRQTEAVLDENYSLFELMTENKGLALEDIFRERVIPHFKKGLDTSEEVSGILEQYDIDKIDSMYLKNVSVRAVKDIVKKMLLEYDDRQELPTPELQNLLLMKTQEDMRTALKNLGAERFFKPSLIDDKTWNEQLKDIEWNIEIDITGEQRNVMEVMTTYQTMLNVVMNPEFAVNKQAQMIVGRILELTGNVSPIEFASVLSSAQERANAAPADPNAAPAPQLNAGAAVAA